VYSKYFVIETMLWQEADGSWALCEALARKHSDFCRPAVFDSNVDESKWLSFTVTMRDPTFFKLMERLTGNVSGTGQVELFEPIRNLLHGGHQL